jgi:hypothetical protein
MNDPPPIADGPQTCQPSPAHEFTWQLLGLLANATVLTALLVYFGWRRAETQANRMGFAESLLGMSTQDYLLRSIGPLLPLLLTVAVAGLVCLWVDRRRLNEPTPLEIKQLTEHVRGRFARIW